MNMNAARSPFAAARPAGLRFATAFTIGCVLVAPVLFGLATGRVPLMYEETPLTGPAVELYGLVMLLGVPFPCAVLAYGLLRRRPWTRPVLLAWWVVLCAAMAALGSWLPPYTGVIGVIGLIIHAPAFWWYLYRKRSVVEYYASLERTT